MDYANAFGMVTPTLIHSKVGFLYQVQLENWSFLLGKLQFWTWARLIVIRPTHLDKSLSENWYDTNVQIYFLVGTLLNICF